METNDRSAIPPCDPELYKDGEHIATLDARPAAAEKWVKKVAERATARLDWHYVGGRACVRFLGDEETRTRVFEVIDALEAELDGTILRTFGPNDPPARSFLPLSLFSK